MVSGGAALLLEGRPSLTPRQVKVALQLTARLMPATACSSLGRRQRQPLFGAPRERRRDGAARASSLACTIGGRSRSTERPRRRQRAALLDAVAAPVGTSVVGALGLLATWLDRTLKPAAPRRRCAAADRSGAIRFPRSRSSGAIRSSDAASRSSGAIKIRPLGQQIIWGDQIYNPAASRSSGVTRHSASK